MKELDSIKEMLISEVCKHSVLWQLKHKDYKDNHKKELVWSNILSSLLSEFSQSVLDQNEFGSVSDIKERWFKLRSNYNTGKSKCKSGQGAPSAKKKKWDDQLSFLDGANATIGLGSSNLASTIAPESNLSSQQKETEAATNFLVAQELQTTFENVPVTPNSPSLLGSFCEVPHSSNNLVTYDPNQIMFDPIDPSEKPKSNLSESQKAFGALVAANMIGLTPRSEREAQIEILQVLQKYHDRDARTNFHTELE